MLATDFAFNASVDLKVRFFSESLALFSSCSPPVSLLQFTFDFEKERALVASASAKKQAQQKALEEQQNRFKGTSTILTPEPAPRTRSPSTKEGGQEPGPAGVKKVDLTEFENGLPPPDPWEVPRNVREELSDVLSPTLGTPGQGHPPQPAVAPKPTVSPRSSAIPVSPRNSGEGVSPLH